jgi:uncharacterized protein (DUF1330 family)
VPLARAFAQTLEFPHMDAARRWYDSPEYTRLRAIRERAATTDLVFAEGYEP